MRVTVGEKEGEANSKTYTRLDEHCMGDDEIRFTMFTGDVSGVLQVSVDFMNIMGGMGNVSIFQGDEEVRSLILDMTPNSWETLELKDIALSGEGDVSIVVGRANSEEYIFCFKNIKATLVEREAKVIQRDDYYPFGLTFNSYRSGTKNNYLFNGVEQDPGTGNYEMRFRGYDPALGRFMQVDPLVHFIPSINPYNFAFNNPISLNDPLGLMGTDPDKEKGKNKKQQSSKHPSRNNDKPDRRKSKSSSGNSSSSSNTSDTDGSSGYNVTVIKGDAAISNFLSQSGQSNGENTSADQTSGGGPTWVDTTVDWIGDNANQLGVTVAAGLNAYAGFEEVKAGAAMLLAPTGVTQVAGVYAIADGTVRMVSAPIQIYGTWTGNTSLENAPHNLLGAAGSLIGPNAQTWMGVGGDFGLSRMKLIQMATKGFSNPNTLMRMKDIGNAGWQIVRPYKDAIQKGLK